MGGSGSCTGFDAPSLSVKALASQCSDADTSKWNADTNHQAWQSDMTSCGTKCLGKGSCVATCMTGKGWSSGCAGCFGNLADCTAKSCLTKCIGGRTPDCVTCLKAAGCDTAAFGSGSCTGFDAPSVSVSSADSKCADAGHATWQQQMTSCGTKCLGKASCVSTCMQGDGWSAGCAGCFGDLAGCTASHCMLKCAGGRTPDCVTCLKAAGFDTPSLSLSSADSKCTDADKQTWDADAGHATW